MMAQPAMLVQISMGGVLFLNEKSIGILGQYDIEVKKTIRARGGFVCDTSRGLILFKEYDVKERHLKFEKEIMLKLKESGIRADYFLEFDSENIVAEGDDGKKYVIKEWYPSRECNIKDRNDITKSAGMLGKIHTILQEKRGDECTELYPCDLRNEFVRHTIEIKRARNYIRRKNNKNPFENELLRSIDKFYQKAEEASAKILECDYESMRKYAYDNQTVCHGAFNHHNIIFVGKDAVAVDYKNAVIDVQVTDLYDFLRKVMEKYNWDMQLGNNIIESYDREKTIGVQDRKLLKVMLQYPEKFWKVTNKYYNGNKAWIADKNMEKLKMVKEQWEVKQKFVDTIL